MKKYLMFLMIIMFSVFLFSIAHANMIVNGSFETGAPLPGIFNTLTSGTLSADDIDDWTVTSGAIDWVGTYWTPSDGSYSIDLCGNINGTIQQSSIATTIGQTYILTFDMAGNPAGPPVGKTMDVMVDGITSSYYFDTTSTSLSSMGWTPHYLIFTASSSAIDISFASSIAGGSAYGPALDNVQLNPYNSGSEPVPEPATMLLLGSGLVSLVGFRRKFKK